MRTQDSFGGSPDTTPGSMVVVPQLNRRDAPYSFADVEAAMRSLTRNYGVTYLPDAANGRVDLEVRDPSSGSETLVSFWGAHREPSRLEDLTFPWLRIGLPDQAPEPIAHEIKDQLATLYTGDSQ